jgi:hypothetical protein
MDSEAHPWRIGHGWADTTNSRGTFCCWPVKSGVPALVVFMNKVDQVDDELLDLEMESQDLLELYE